MPAAPSRVSAQGSIRLSDLPDLGDKIAVYGFQGSGKTRFAASFAEAGPLLHIVCAGNGMHEAYSIRGHEYEDNIDILPLERVNLLPEIIKRNINNYATFVLDHVTDFCDKVLCQNVLNMKEVPEQFNWGLATQQQYGAATLQTKTLLRPLISYKCNAIFLGHERTYDQVTDGGEVAMPWVSMEAFPKVAGWVTGNCNHVFHTFIRRKIELDTVKMKGGPDKVIRKQSKEEEYEYCALLGPSDKYIVKIRARMDAEVPPTVMVNPSYSKLKEYL